MTDQQIIEYLRHNKYQKAVNGLYDVLSPAKKYVQSNNGSADDAKDVFQDALVILYKNMQSGTFNLTVSLKTYLLAIVKNLWFQELRRRNKTTITTEPLDIPYFIDGDDNEDFEIAKAAFNLLGEKCRQLLILFYFKKKTYRELASFLAFGDERTAKNQKYRCLQKAKENFITLSIKQQ